MQSLQAPEHLDADQREAYATAGEAALRTSLGRFPADQQDLFWHAICRCYGRSPVEAAPALDAAIPPAHIIDAALAAGAAELPK
ncbi:MAG: hypothetical protein PGN34_22825 [Methylobacterium frigidaeris]